MVAASGCGDGTVALPEAEVLGAALDQTASSSGIEVKTWTAQTLSSSALGVDTSTAINPDRPTVVAEVGSDLSHVRVDLGSLYEPLVGTDLEVGMELWTTPSRLVVDTRSFETLLDASPDAQLGPMDPALAYVDIAAAGVNGPQVVAAIAGAPLPDLAELAASLPVALADVAQVGDDPVSFRGTSTFAAFQEALGGDIEMTARSVAAGVALNLGVDVDDLTKVYVDFYRTVPVEVVVELDDDGFVHVISTKADLSGVWTHIFDEANASVLGIPASDAREARAQFADTIWVMETRMEFEPNDDLIVPAAPQADLDRTTEWLDFLVQSGLIGN